MRSEEVENKEIKIPRRFLVLLKLHPRIKNERVKSQDSSLLK